MITFPEAIERAQKQGVETTGTGWDGGTAWLIQRTEETMPMDDTVALIDKNTGDLLVELFDEEMLDWPQAGGPQLVAAGGFNPGQARVPKGNDNGGEWIQTAGGLRAQLSPGGREVGVAVGDHVYRGKAIAPHGREQQLRDLGGATPTLFESDGSPESAQAYHDLMAKATAANKYGAAVTVYEPKDYEGMRLFLTGDGSAGVALRGDEIVSVFKDPASKDKGMAQHLMAAAIEQGGRRADAFDTVLPKLYAGAGLVVKSRLKFDPEYKPDGWDYETFAAWNNGQPDVVFMQYDPNAVGSVYVPGMGDYVDDYDAGIASVQGELNASAPPHRDSGVNLGVRPDGAAQLGQLLWRQFPHLGALDEGIALGVGHHAADSTPGTLSGNPVPLAPEERAGHGIEGKGATMLTVYDGHVYEWEPPLAPETPVTINGERVTNFAVLSDSPLGDMLLDIEVANPERRTYAGSFNPAQARVPKGNREGGRWVDVVGGLVRGLGGALTGMGPTPGDTSKGGALVETVKGQLPRYAGNHAKVAPDAVDKNGKPYGADAAQAANDLYDKAELLEPKISSDMQNALSEGQSLAGLEYRLKEPTSLAKKIRGDMAEKSMSASEAAANMWDVNRYTAISDTANLAEDYKSTIADLESQGYEVFQKKNTWGFPDPTNPYQGINIKLLGPSGEQIELQFHTPESLAVKEKQHTMYDEQKLLTKGTPEWLKLSEDMMKMSVDLPVPPGIDTI